MNARRLPNGNLLIPRRAEGPDGLIGEGMDEIGPDDPEYADWLAYLTRKEKPAAVEDDKGDA